MTNRVDTRGLIPLPEEDVPSDKTYSHFPS